MTQRATAEKPSPKALSSQRQRYVRFLPLALAVIVLTALLATGVWRHFSLDELRLRRHALKAFVGIHPLLSVLIYMGVYCMVVALSIPGALFMTLTGGFLFGVVLGGAAAAVGVSSGAVIMFLVAHTALGGVIRNHTGANGFIQKVEAGVRAHAFSYLLFLRLMPAAPIWLVNIAAAFVRTPLWIYASATIIGIAPSCFIYASIGASLDRVFAAGGPLTLGSLFHLDIFLALFALALLALAPIAWQRFRQGR